MTKLDELELAIRRAESAKRLVNDSTARVLRDLADALTGIDNEWHDLAIEIKKVLGEQ